MLLHYFRLGIRTLVQHKTSFIINLLGMSIALGCCITAYVNYQFNVDFDQEQQRSNELYRISFIRESEGKEIPYGVTPMPVGALLRENFKDLPVIRYISKDAQFRIGDEMFQKEFVYADPNFTELFTLERMMGSLKLNDKSLVLISDKLALTYYGTTDAIGKPLTQIVSGVPREFVIGGVYKAFPYNSSFRFDLLTAFDNYFTDPTQQTTLEHDWKRWTTTFLSITNPQQVAGITQHLQQYVKPQNEARQDLQAKQFYIEPFVGMSQRAVREKNEGHWFNQPMPPAAVIAPFFMAGLLLLVACFNFTNHAIAMAGKRLKEIGIRKVMGGKRKELIAQFLAESFVFCVLALIVSLLLAEFLVAGWDALWPGIELAVRYNDNASFLIMLAGLMIITALLAGSYPAVYISSFKPIQVLKGATQFGGTNLFTKTLLVFQVSISLAAVIFALAFYYNSKFQKSFDLGYSYQSVIQIPVENESQFTQLKNALANRPLIHSTGGSEHHIFARTYTAALKTEKDEKEVDVLNIGDDYFKTVNVRLMAGREFEKESASDVKEAMIVNEEFVKVFELGSNPLGQRITFNDTTQFYVIGVVKDVYLKALFEPLAPLAFRYTPPANYKYLVASTDPENLAIVNDQIKTEWKKLFPNNLYTGRLMEQNMVMALEHFDNVVVLYTFLGAVAIIMSVSGLYSLVSMQLQRRTKELGIRKVLGAPLLHVVLLCSKLFLVILTVSFLVGSLMGSFLVNKLMDTVWEYYVAIDIRVISLAVLILFVIAAATVSLRIFKATVTNPAEALRYE
jgi:ABC-type antimicrobial peptide transport system permease subunit